MRGAGWLLVGVVLACADTLVPSPFVAPRDAGGTTDIPVVIDASTPDLPALGIGPDQAVGGPCVDDAQCADALACTTGVCDQRLGRCIFSGDDPSCDDGLFCNGSERCDPLLGCRPGPPTSCSDSTSCTIDICDEASDSCEREPRDMDADGDVDGNCQPGADCNDLDPRVSSLELELCGNGVDDDCDGAADEADCSVPRFDVCADALAVPAPGRYEVVPAGAALDYAAACSTAGSASRDLVLTVSVPDDAAGDVELVARTERGALGFATVAICGQAPAASDCRSGGLLASGESVARLRLPGSEPGERTVYLSSDAASPIAIERRDVAAEPLPDNVECAAPRVLEPGQPVVADLTSPGATLEESACLGGRGNLYYRFSLAGPSDVTVLAESLDGLGEPRLALLPAGCSAELGCARGPQAALRRHSLAAGDYALAVSASGPSNLTLLLQTSAPTPAPPTDVCLSAPQLTPNLTETLSFVGHIDDIASGCAPGLVDAAKRLTLSEASDVMLLARFSSGDSGSVALAAAACGASDTLACQGGGRRPARTTIRGLAAGQYIVVAESFFGLPATVTALVRPAQPVTLVPAAEDCASALDVGPLGGFFQGNTANAANNFTASCDFASPVAAADQMLRLALDRPRRVVLDARGSEFDALINLRRGPECPGEEVPGACVADPGGLGSLVDENLPAGEYQIQIDGYAGTTGAWSLDVYLLDP